ncbi:hypothetical protein DF3PB_260003 [uncultured Defluviicoccus sp.]|uniref:Uncharacterized protein n=1 Tax=metagenome TaxID=256318 RepID=A0A380TCN8_9ZZZZ|nr:hypothetical protein DF3PB_260003 [uncultured Defluviicoccus sp.]
MRFIVDLHLGGKRPYYHERFATIISAEQLTVNCSCRHVPDMLERSGWSVHADGGKSWRLASGDRTTASSWPCR